MAYMRDLPKWPECDHYGCTKKAAVQVVNARNAPVGHYCRKHGEKKRDEVTAAERG